MTVQHLPGRPRRCLVIGGGASGLAAALALCDAADAQSDPAPRFEVELIEAADRLGGAIETVRRDDYLVERGPDMFITDKPGGLDLCRRLGLEDQLVKTDPQFGGSLVVRAGRPVPVPESFQLLGTPKILSLIHI